MKRVSPEDSSPLIVRCEKCGHEESGEIQIPPPWPPGDNDPPENEKEPKTPRKEFRLFDQTASSFSTDSSDNDQVLPIGWILLWILVIAFVGGILLLVY